MFNEMQKRNVLIFYCGIDRPSARRVAVVGAVLRRRGYRVHCAGAGPFARLVQEAGLLPHKLPTDGAESVEAERALIDRLKPYRVIADSYPSLRSTAAATGIEVIWITPAYAMPEDAQIDRENKDRYWLCDVPTVHPLKEGTPTNSVFVGPLLDKLDCGEQQAAECKRIYWDVKLLGADWPAIQKALQELGFKGVQQWIIPPSGMWLEPIERSRLVIPGFSAKVAAQVDIFAGGGDHEFFYQALFGGIPFIGLPANEQQEQFATRLQALGLGIKVSPRDFARPTAIVQSVERLLNHYAIFAERCRAFAAEIRKWQDVDRMVEQWPEDGGGDHQTTREEAV